MEREAGDDGRVGVGGFDFLVLMGEDGFRWLFIHGRNRGVRLDILYVSEYIPEPTKP